MDKLKTYLKHPLSFVLLILIGLAAVVTVASIIFIIIYILVNGIPNLTSDLFSLHYNSKNQSMLPSIFNTVFITFLTLLIAVPIGIFSAVYLVEYAKKGSKLVKVIRVTTETLAGIPSIVFGLFGFLAFVIALGWGYSMIAGVLTLVMMVLPTIIRTTEEALLAVPNSYREGSFGLGAGKIRTIFKIIVPTAIPGILSGVILAIGRIVGETAALIYTSGTVAETATSLTDSARTLSVHLYCLLSEGLFTNQAYATAVILLLLVVGINALSNFIAKKLAKK
ncbi:MULTISPECIES: phosphate ABC transporter permease PstA [Ruminococcus]|uniref:Phosphate transport system permease protein PstA n=1 Tax=Ruminococcus bovis TaxID=2564099 RepID=A0A4V1G4Y1_9FIRM|nr:MULTISPECIES: phosphate ABC transporter permease PstA [Ruminococcus]MEE3439793.1 phosphate ABC transporter permease PstA [Ruminococcus sp.]QCT06303.1 phosphate ABC transporter permease PstA [Ruminococcus bovis]